MSRDSFNTDSKLAIDAFVLEQAKFVKTENDNIATRVLNETIEDAAKDDGNGGKVIQVSIVSEVFPPSNILLTNDDVDSGANVGTLIGYIVPEGGVGPYLYSIIDDPDDKFAISYNELITKNPVSYPDQNLHVVTIRVTDVNDTEFDKSFIIEVNQTPAQPFVNTKEVVFNGTDEHCEAGYNSSFSGKQKFTGSAWITPATISGSQCIMSHFGAGGLRGFRFTLSSVGVLFLTVSEDGVNQEIFIGTTIITGDDETRTHVAWAFDGEAQTIKTWVNNVVDIDDTTTAQALYDVVGVPFRVGARGDSTLPETSFFNGKIDEVSIYNEALTDLRISEIYNFGEAANVSNMTSSQYLISWWRMGDSDTYPTLTDQVASNDLSMENMAAQNIITIGFEDIYSLGFNGVDERIDTTADYSGRTQLTMAGWFYRDAISQRLDIGQCDDANVNRIKLVRNNNGSIYAVVAGVALQCVSDITGWEHIALVFDGDNVSNGERLKIYRNASELTPVSIPTLPTEVPSINRDFRIGQDNGSGTYSEGTINEVVVFDVPLSSSEVTELYNSGKALDVARHSQATEVINWWRMGDELTTPTMPDQIGTDDGTLINMDDTNKDTNVP